MEKLKSTFRVTHTHSVTQDDFAKFVNCQADFGLRGVLLVEVGAETPDQKQCPVGMITMLQNQQDTNERHTEMPDGRDEDGGRGGFCLD